MSKIDLLPVGDKAHCGIPRALRATTSVGLTSTSAAAELLQVLGGAFQIHVAEVVEEVQGDREPSVFLLTPIVHPLPDQGKVEVVETRELPYDLLIGPADDAALDLREMGIGNAGRRFHIAQSQAPMGAGALQEMTKIGFSTVRLDFGRRLNRRLRWHVYRLGERAGVPSYRYLRPFANALRFSATVAA
jgi:hypothetical protein